MHSLKKDIIINLSRVPFLQGMDNNNVIIMTSAGTYSGKLISNEDDDSEIALPFANALSELADRYRQDNHIDKNTLLDGNDGYLILKDVQLRTNGPIINMPFVVLFFDQIVGISIGNVE